MYSLLYLKSIYGILDFLHYLGIQQEQLQVYDWPPTQTGDFSLLVPRYNPPPLSLYN